MTPTPCYRKIVELDVMTRVGDRIDGRFLIRDGWTLSGHLMGSADSVELTGPSSNARLDIQTARDLDVLQRVGPVENGRPDRNLGYVGLRGCMGIFNDRGLVVTEADEQNDLSALESIDPCS